MELSLLLDECRRFGWDVMQVHPKTKMPISFSTPSIECHMSALARAHEGFPSGWFLIEARSVSDSVFAKVTGHKLEQSYPQLYGHAMIGMGLANLLHCAVFLSSDSGATYLEIIEFKKSLYTKLTSLADQLIKEAPAPVIQDDCGKCSYERPCWDDNYIAPVSCYSCHFMALGNGGVHCQKWHTVMNSADANHGCTEHLYQVSLVRFGKYIGSTNLSNGDLAHIYDIGGKHITNCGGRAPKSGLMYTSREIEIGGVFAMNDPQVQALKEQFAVKIIEP
jgi:hypothetical protein